MAKCNTRIEPPEEFNFDFSRNEIVMIHKALAKISDNEGRFKCNMTNAEVKTIFPVYVAIGKVINVFNLSENNE